MRNAEGFLCVFFFAPILRGTRTAAGVFVPDGATLFLHRLSGVRELRKRVRPFWAGSFSLRFSGELRSAERRKRALMPRGRIREVETLVSTPLMNLPVSS